MGLKIEGCTRILGTGRSFHEAFSRFALGSSADKEESVGWDCLSTTILAGLRRQDWPITALSLDHRRNREILGKGAGGDCRQAESSDLGYGYSRGPDVGGRMKADA
jgi:hypothetical protein